jgi:hypothetical protein
MPTGKLREERTLNHREENAKMKNITKGPSPQSSAARNRSAMSKQLIKGFGIGPDLNFLLTCSDSTLDSYELARMALIANLRSEMQEILDQIIETTAQAGLARWFRNTDREALRRALETPYDPIALAKEQVRRQRRRDEEFESELTDILSLNPGQAHRTASATYVKRNIAEGKCAQCPKPLARNSVRYCEKHLTAARLRMTPSKGKPGDIGWLYGETAERSQGRQPGTLTSLALSREKKTRSLLAELGIPPESAAVSLKATKEALLKCMASSEADAIPADALFQVAVIPSRTTGQHALRDLLAAGAIQRIGGGGTGSPFLYFAKDTQLKRGHQ